MAIINGPGVITTNRLFAKKTVDIVTSNWLRVAEIKNPSVGANQLFSVEVDSSLGFKVSQCVFNVIYNPILGTHSLDVIVLNSFFSVASGSGSGSGATSGSGGTSGSGSGGTFLGATGTRITTEEINSVTKKYLEIFISWSEVYEEFAEALVTFTTVVGTDFTILPSFTINLLDRYEDPTLEPVITPTLLFQNNTSAKKAEESVLTVVNASVTSSINSVNSTVSSLNTSKADLTELDGLGDRVSTVEETISALDTSLDSFLNIVDSFQGLSRSFGTTFEITVANWSGSGPYTATKTYTMLTNNDLFFIKGNTAYNSANISVSQNGGVLTFTTNNIPNQTVGGNVIVIKVLGELQ